MAEQPKDTTSFKEAPFLAIKGFLMGSADIVPGVSGGTMALILGIYERLLRAIRAYDVALARLLARGELRAAAEHAQLGFLIPLCVGIAAALVFFTRVVSLPGLVVTHPVPVYSFFFGLIVGSMLVLLRALEQPRWHELAALGCGVGLGLLAVTVVPFETPTETWFVFLCGALAICAMILPGVSGSFVLLILRKYVYVFDAIGRFDLQVLIPFALGAACGLAAFSRLLVWLLNRFRRHTISVIIGLLGGSLWMVWPFQARVYEVVANKSRLVHSSPVWPQAVDAALLVPLTLGLVGLALVLAIERIAGTKSVASPSAV